MLWVLKKLSTNENLTEPGLLPRDWGPIFGLHGFKNKLSNLAWLGEAYSDMGWVEVDGDVLDLAEHPSEEEKKEELVNVVNADLLEGLEKIKANSGLTNEEKQVWVVYCKQLKNALNSPNFPNVHIPAKPVIK